MAHDDSILLGKTVAASRHYAPSVLYPVARAIGRETLGIAGLPLPFCGVDVWHGYEVSWLDGHGKPRVALARFVVPCDSPCIVESKSFKLYLNSLNYTRFENQALVAQVIARDLSRVVGVAVTVEIMPFDRAQSLQPVPIEGVLLDDLPVAIDDFEYQPSLLQRKEASVVVEEQLVSHLFRSNCPVTGQPDWASIRIGYRGQALDHASVLRYLLSFRDHQEFHEQCVERIFTDVQRQVAPDELTVEAFFTRRGGLDINPVRSTRPLLPSPLRHLRQ